MNDCGKFKKAHLMRHKPMCYSIYFMPSTMECVIYTTLKPTHPPPTVTAEVQASHPSVGSS